MEAARSRPEILYPADAIAAAVARMAGEIRRDLAGRVVHVVPVMNASLYFAVDLLRALGDGIAVDGLSAASVSSCGASREPASRPSILAFPSGRSVARKTVLVIDTILDTGATVAAVREEALARGALDVRVACLLDKKARRRVPVRADWVGFEAPDVFLVGYGLDDAGAHRTLPYVAALRDRGDAAASSQPAPRDR